MLPISIQCSCIYQAIHICVCVKYENATILISQKGIPLKTETTEVKIHFFRKAEISA